MKQAIFWKASLFIGLLLSRVVDSRPSLAADEVNFANKSVVMTIGFAAGGGVDLYGRTLAKHLGRNLTGRPSIIVANQPGAGGVIALNDWPRKADSTGLSLTIGAQSQTDPDALIRSHAKFDPSTFKMIGGIGAYSQGLFIRTDSLKRLYDKSMPPVVMGLVGSSLRGGSYQVLWGVAFLDWNVKWVLGYHSTGEARQALERGEIEMATFGATKDFEYLMLSEKFTVVSQTGQVHEERRVKRPVLRDAAIFSDLMRDKIKDAIARKAFSYWENVSQIGMWVALPPTVPDHIVATYVNAFEATSSDASFQDEYSRIDPDSSKENKSSIENLVKELSKVSPETLKYLAVELNRQGFTLSQ